MPLPSPGPAHARLERLVGVWSGPERMHPSPGFPEGYEAHARNENRAALSGFVVLTDYRQLRDGAVSFEGHGVYRYDAGADEYVLHWFDVVGGNQDLFRGSFEADRMVLVAEGAGGFLRQIHDLSEPGLLLTTLERSSDGRRWEPWLEGRYRSGG